MGLNQITQAHIEQVMREHRKNPRHFVKSMLARTQNENLYYAILVEGLAMQAGRNIAESDASEIELLSKKVKEWMSELGMLWYRALELAALNGTPANNTIMSDPNFGASPERIDAALEEARLLIMKIKLLDNNRGEKS